MSRNAKRSVTSHSSTNHHHSAQILSPVASAEASVEPRKKSTSRRRRVELGVGAVILAGVLYLPFSPLLSMADPSQANTPAAAGHTKPPGG